jgi:signal transduction histidine kinase
MQEHATHASSTAAAAEFLPHGFCYQWNTPLLALHVTADLLIGLSYVAISVALAYLVHRMRKDIPFSAVFIAFGLFIITCGFTHFIEVWTLWQPVYWFAGVVKGVTAAASVATAIAMPFTIPKVVSTVQDAKLAREREIAATRADVLQQQNVVLAAQALEMELQRAAASALATELEAANIRLRDALTAAEQERTRADEANRAKSEFLAVMSHELRTPLHAIGGYVDLIDLGLRGPVTAAQQLDLRRVRSAQQRLLSIITDILNFARVEAGFVEYRDETVVVEALVNETVVLISPQLMQRRQTLTVHVDPGTTALADAEKVSQVLLNLLSNAHKYAGDGAHIDVVATNDRDSVCIRVSDNGPGIPLDKQAAIFEPFVQARGGLTRPHDGTGLGLSISRDLARGMGGDLLLSGEPGNGVEFTLVLRMATPARLAG